jgi:hypothetical protein
VYRDDRIVHFDGDPEEFADGDTGELATRIQNYGHVLRRKSPRRHGRDGRSGCTV